ncbi:carbamoyltransferase C-terminal domain-containing protein [Nocardia takedensis]
MQVLPTDELSAEVAKQLANGQVLGIFRGGAEAGPRALGCRSILADPRIAAVHYRLAHTIKRREPFRPFAPIARLAAAERYVDLKAGPTPYMSVAVKARDELYRVAPILVHANGTARMQTLDGDADPFVVAVLEHFERLTGSAVLINTSLNMKGEPTAGTWQAALSCLSTMNLDGLVLGDLLIRNR